MILFPCVINFSNVLLRNSATRSPIWKISSLLLCRIMAGNNDQMRRLEENAQMAENIISDIYSKLSELGQGGLNISLGGAETPELLRLRQENEALRLEVSKWKELLLLRDIRNGSSPIAGRVQDVGKTVEMKKCKSEGAGLKIQSVVPSGVTGNQSKSSKSTAALNNVTTTNKATTESKSNQNLGNKNQKSNKDLVKPGSATAPPPTKSSTSVAGGTPSTTEVVDVSRLDFRIGLITECTRHPDADALYVEKIDLGEDKPRTVISGLVKHIPLEEMQNRMVVILTNLKPAKMRGILSEGMVMCASSPDKVEILIPPAGSAPGDVVEVEGFPRAPDAVLNPKKKIWETVAPDLMTNAKKEATYKGKLWKVLAQKGDLGVITTSTLANTIIK